jgi:hypothetical protein
MSRKTTVADEFEIDPKQNNGLNYQYHDVQRGRAERKLMHGGDCECCTGVGLLLLLPSSSPLWSFEEGMLIGSTTKQSAHYLNTTPHPYGKIPLRKKGTI